MNKKKLNIGLFGFGVVGEGIYRVLNEYAKLNATITKVVIKHLEKPRNADVTLFSDDPDFILTDEKINVVIELIDNADEAYAIVKKALQQGKNVVTANKKMIAEHLDELIVLSKNHQVSLLYEAAVCGSIPVIRNLEEYYDNDFLCSISGIVNGYTNYILTKMAKEKIDYQSALISAQELGFAESNPSLDVSGRDAVNKLSILAKHAYGKNVSPEEIVYQGIENIQYSDLQYANEKGYVLKLIAHSFIEEEKGISIYVLPTFLNKNEILANVEYENNGIVIGTQLANEQFLFGKGAGRYPTSSAVLSDISALQYDYKYEYRKSAQVNGTKINKNVLIKIYVAFDAAVSLDESYFESVSERFSSAENNYIIGWIKLQKLSDSSWLKDSGLSIVAFQNSQIDTQTFLLSRNEECYSLN